MTKGLNIKFAFCQKNITQEIIKKRSPFAESEPPEDSEKG
jgi:hypothetical protein